MWLQIDNACSALSRKRKPLRRLTTPTSLRFTKSVLSRAPILWSPNSLMEKSTTAYLYPEQARALEVDTRTDIWSLGVVLYEMISGHAPFKGEPAGDTSPAILKTEPPALSQFEPHVPPEMERIVKKALQK